jgi:phosphatidylglycerophosphate synthase
VTAAGAGLAVLGVLALALVALSVTGARRSQRAVPDLDAYLARWRQLHGGYDPRGSRLLHGWLRLSYAAARPLAVAGVAPDVLTLWGLWCALAVLVAALGGGRWLLAAALLLGVSGLADSLDGCVAVLTDRATRWGYVLDSLVDRVADVVYLLALVAAGGAAWAAVAAGTALFLLEYLRARAGNAGVEEIAVVTVGERGARVALCAGGLLSAGLFAERAALVAGSTLGVLALLGAVALVQLAVAVRRRLRS